jgi:predicted dehydrogenase
MNFGVIGLGKISTTFTKEFDFIDGSEIIIAGSRDKTKAAEFASTHGIAAYGSYEDVINHPLVDAIYIGTPHNSHFDIAIQALNSGKHVLCEKSITTDANKYKILSQLAFSKNLFLMDAMWTYFLPAVVHAKSWADSGAIGKIKYVNIDFAFPAPQNFESRLYNPHLAGGALLDIGVYVLYNAFLYLGSDYTALNCMAEFSQSGVDESLSVQLDYGQAKSNLYCSVKHRALSSAYIYGEEGYIVIPLFWKTTKALRYDVHDQLIDEFIDPRLSHGFEFEIKHFISCIGMGMKESPLLPHHLTLKVMETMDKIRSKIGLVYPFD